MKKVLTGIKPTGSLHIGNYFGAIGPAIEKSNSNEGFFFVADLHALNQVRDKNILQQNIRSVLGVWIASGLDLNKSCLYRQSDIPEITELSVILSAVAPKGWMNKAHAYKAAVDANNESGKDTDAGVNMGLYTYPILMAADILAVGVEEVPVGKDQIQHVEIARDIAINFNKLYGEVLVVPEYSVVEESAVIPGLDGRKMSKSYDNVIPLIGNRDVWTKLVAKIPTDSVPPGVKREENVVTNSGLFLIYESVATRELGEQMKTGLMDGSLGWKVAKEMLVDALEMKFGKISENYNEIMNSPEKIDQALESGKNRVEPIIRGTVQRVKDAVGL